MNLGLKDQAEELREQNSMNHVLMWASLTSRLSGAVHGDFYGSLVRGHLRRVGEHGDGQCETLACIEKGKTERKLEIRTNVASEYD